MQRSRGYLFHVLMIFERAHPPQFPESGGFLKDLKSRAEERSSCRLKELHLLPCLLPPLSRYSLEAVTRQKLPVDYSADDPQAARDLLAAASPRKSPP